jgi:hypothetical protein
MRKTRVTIIGNATEDSVTVVTNFYKDQPNRVSPSIHTDLLAAYLAGYGKISCYANLVYSDTLFSADHRRENANGERTAAEKMYVRY